jgi:hypothetical protein
MNMRQVELRNSSGAINVNERMNIPVVKVKVKQSRYRPGVAQEGSRKLRFPGYMTTTQDGGKFVSLTHRPPLPPGNAPGTHFC